MEEVVKSCQRAQLAEVDMLEAMYTPSELVFDSETVDGLTFKLLTNFTIKLHVEEHRIDIYARLPQNYPLQDRPAVYIRSQGNFYDKKLNDQLRRWLDEQEFGLPLVLEVIKWIEENAPKHVVIAGVTPSQHSDRETSSYVRYYIRSHHIYSEKKRGDICALAKDLNGFMAAGKPGIIVLEGVKTACEYFWLQVRRWQWHKIQLLATDEFSEESEQKLKPFVELPVNSDAHSVKMLLAEAGLEEHFNTLYKL